MHTRCHACQERVGRLSSGPCSDSIKGGYTSKEGLGGARQCPHAPCTGANSICNQCCLVQYSSEPNVVTTVVAPGATLFTCMVGELATQLTHLSGKTSLRCNSGAWSWPRVQLNSTLRQHSIAPSKTALVHTLRRPWCLSILRFSTSPFKELCLDAELVTRRKLRCFVTFNGLISFTYLPIRRRVRTRDHVCVRRRIQSSYCIYLRVLWCCGAPTHDVGHPSLFRFRRRGVTKGYVDSDSGVDLSLCLAANRK